MSEDIALSVIIPSLRRPRRLESLSALLDDLGCQEDVPAHEILVVSNPPEEFAEKIPGLGSKVKFFSSDVGVNRARNLGIERAHGEILLFLDDDCRIDDPYFLKKHFDLHRQYPKLTVVGGIYVSPSQQNLWSAIYHRQQIRWLESREKPTARADYWVGGNASIKKSLLGETRFDPEIAFGGAETDLVFRLAYDWHSSRRFDDVLKVVHDPRLSFFDLIRKAFKQGVGASRLAAKDLEPTVVFYGGEMQSRWSDEFYHLPFRAGRTAGTGHSLPLILLRCATQIGTETVRRLTAIRYSPIFSEIFVAIQAALELDSKR